MTKEAYEVLYEHLELPKKFVIIDNDNEVKKKYMVITDRDHFISWIDRRAVVNSIWDWTLRMIENKFGVYIKDKLIIE